MTKSEVAHMCADGPHHPCRIWDPQRSIAGDKIRHCGLRKGTQMLKLLGCETCAIKKPHITANSTSRGRCWQVSHKYSAGVCRCQSRKLLAGVRSCQAGDGTQRMHAISALTVACKHTTHPSGTDMSQENFPAGLGRCHKGFWQVSAGVSRHSGKPD